MLNVGQKCCRMLQGEHSAILLTFIKLPFVIKILVLSIFEWVFYTCNISIDVFENVGSVHILLILFDSLFSACSFSRISKLKGMECRKILNIGTNRLVQTSYSQSKLMGAQWLSG